MKSELAVKREYAKVQKALSKQLNDVLSREHIELWGARQALAWVMEDNAMAASKACAPSEKK